MFAVSLVYLLKGALFLFFAVHNRVYCSCIQRSALFSSIS
jgi:hypothetical protein